MQVTYTEKQLLFRAFSKIILTGIIAGLVTWRLVYLDLKNVGFVEKSIGTCVPSDKIEIGQEVHNLSLIAEFGRGALSNESSISCGIVPYHDLNPWTVQVFTPSCGSCGGSFISSTRILTAAHCIDINGTRDTRYDVIFNRRSYEASLVAFEPHYYEKMIGDGKTDLAILEVKVKPDLVVPLCLPPKNYSVNNTDLILTSPRGGYHEKNISVIDGLTCWQRFFWNQVAANSTWCGKDQEFKIAVEAYEKQWRNEIEDFDIKSLKTVCSEKTIQYTFPGDSGSPLVQQDQNGRWTLIAIVRGMVSNVWKDDLCDEQTKNVTFDDFQPTVPNLPWIYETLTG